VHKVLLGGATLYDVRSRPVSCRRIKSVQPPFDSPERLRRVSAAIGLRPLPPSRPCRLPCTSARTPTPQPGGAAGDVSPSRGRTIAGATTYREWPSRPPIGTWRATEHCAARGEGVATTCRGVQKCVHHVLQGGGGALGRGRAWRGRSPCSAPRPRRHSSRRSTRRGSASTPRRARPDSSSSPGSPAQPAGDYLIFCGVAGHGAAGMWIRFQVSASAKTPALLTPAPGKR